MLKRHLDTIPQSNRTGYPSQFADVVAGHWYRQLGSVAGLTHMGVRHDVLKPGA